jgi:hypothetical protein
LRRNNRQCVAVTAHSRARRSIQVPSLLRKALRACSGRPAPRASRPRPARVVKVKKKMTADEFVRNNRGINGGEDLPRDFLRALYASIAADEIRISSEAQARAHPTLPSPGARPLPRSCPAPGLWARCPRGAEPQASVSVRCSCARCAAAQPCRRAAPQRVGGPAARCWQGSGSAGSLDVFLAARARCALRVPRLSAAPARRRATRRRRRCCGRSWRCSRRRLGGPCCSRPRMVGPAAHPAMPSRPAAGWCLYAVCIMCRMADRRSPYVIRALAHLRDRMISRCQVAQSGHMGPGPTQHAAPSARPGAGAGGRRAAQACRAWTARCSAGSGARPWRPSASCWTSRRSRAWCARRSTGCCSPRASRRTTTWTRRAPACLLRPGRPYVSGVSPDPTL